MPLPLIVTSVVTGTGPSQLQLRNRLASELGYYLPTTVSTLATNADAARVVLANEARDDEAGWDFLGTWVYARASGELAAEQRRIVTQPEAGYQGPRGALIVSRPFSAALAAGRIIEITNPLPVTRHLGVKGLNQCIDEALTLIRIPARLSVTGNGTYEYDLAAYSWLTQEGQIVGIADTQSDPGFPALDSPDLPRIVANGVTRTLVTQVSYSADETFYLDAIVPADRLISDGTTWAFVPQSSTPGLLGDAYQTAAPEQWAHAFAMVKALQFLSRWVTARRDLAPEDKALALGEIAERRRTWATAAARIKLYEFPRPRPQAARATVSVGAPPSWS